jgi:hypothetical protein
MDDIQYLNPGSQAQEVMCDGPGDRSTEPAAGETFLVRESIVTGWRKIRILDQS